MPQLGKNRFVSWAVWLLAVFGALSLLSHVFDGLVWAFEPDPIVESGSGNHDGPEHLLASGKYFLALDVTGAGPAATVEQGGQSLANCRMQLSLQSQAGSPPFLPVPETVRLINGVSTSASLDYSVEVAGTGLYTLYVQASTGCEWRLTVSKL
jgi:hypothetical protein